MFFLNRCSVSCNLFCASFLVAPCLVVAVQPSMVWIPIKKKNFYSTIVLGFVFRQDWKFHGIPNNAAVSQSWWLSSEAYSQPCVQIQKQQNDLPNLLKANNKYINWNYLNVFMVNFEQIQYINLVFLHLTLKI